MAVKLVQYHWHLWFSFRNLVLIIGLGLLIGINSGLSLWSLQNEVSGQLSVWDGILTAFLGPSSEYFSFVEMLTWLVIPVVFLYFVALIPAEHDQSFLIIRSGRRFQWFISQAAVLVFITLLFIGGLSAGIFIGASLVLPYVPPDDVLLQYLNVFGLSTEEAITWAIILTLTTLYLLGTLYLTLYLLIGSRIYTYATLVGICISSLLLTHNAMWLPATQMLVRYHAPFSVTPPFFTFGWSLTYNVMGIMLLTVIRQWLGKHYDFIRSEK